MLTSPSVVLDAPMCKDKDGNWVSINDYAMDNSPMGVWQNDMGYDGNVWQYFAEFWQVQEFLRNYSSNTI
jgi:hypothetical protein